MIILSKINNPCSKVKLSLGRQVGESFHLSAHARNESKHTGLINVSFSEIKTFLVIPLTVHKIREQSKLLMRLRNRGESLNIIHPGLNISKSNNVTGN